MQPLPDTTAVDRQAPRQSEHAARRKAARQAAIGILKRRACSCGELAGRLVRKGFDAQLAADLARDLQQAGLLDDAAYAESIAHAASAGQPVSEAFLVRKLTARLIDPDLALATARRMLAGRDAVAEAAGFAARKLGAGRLPPETARRRIAAALARRGLDVDTITAALQRVAPAPPEDGSEHER